MRKIKTFKLLCNNSKLSKPLFKLIHNVYNNPFYHHNNKTPTFRLFRSVIYPKMTALAFCPSTTTTDLAFCPSTTTTSPALAFYP